MEIMYFKPNICQISAPGFLYIILLYVALVCASALCASAKATYNRIKIYVSYIVSRGIKQIH